MRLNLLPIRRLAESLTMNDECIITRDPEGTGDDVWDEATGTYVKPPGDRQTLYDGVCSVYPMSPIAQEEERGGEEIAATKYWVGIPMSAEVTTRPEDQVQITAVDPEQGDPELVGQVLIVDSQEFSTLASTRRLRCRILNEVP